MPPLPGCLAASPLAHSPARPPPPHRVRELTSGAATCWSATRKCCFVLLFHLVFPSLTRCLLHSLSSTLPFPPLPSPVYEMSGILCDRVPSLRRRKGPYTGAARGEVVCIGVSWCIGRVERKQGRGEEGKFQCGKAALLRSSTLNSFEKNTRSAARGSEEEYAI